MQMSAACMICVLRKQADTIQNYPDEPKKARYMQELMRTMASAGRDATAPELTRQFDELHRAYFGFGEDLTEQKKLFNQQMLSIEEDVARRIEAAEDPIRAAIQFARAGNYIDLGAMDSVDPEKMMALLFEAQAECVDEGEYARFRAELDAARSLALLCDNAGEIVMDKLMLRTFRRAYPHLAMTAVVRGLRTSNDATLEDAREVGLDQVARVIGNGTGLAGTVWEKITDEAREVISSADLVLSKGQGNFETLFGCGFNVYYVFLNKCDWFVRRFERQRFSGMFVNDRRLNIDKYL